MKKELEHKVLKIAAQICWMYSDIVDHDTCTD
jgi:hypothetical protein